MFRSIGRFEWYPSRGTDAGDVSGVVIGRGSDPAYARSYLLAGNHLVVEIAIPSASAYHPLTVPALYCFRHALELMLKTVLRECDEVFTKYATQPCPPMADAKLLGSHSLLILERALSEKLRHHEYDFLADRHRAIIERIHNLDPGGMSLRYGMSKNGQTLLPAGWAIDITAVERAVSEVFEHLDLIYWSLQGFSLSNPIDHHQMWSY